METDNNWTLFLFKVVSQYGFGRGGRDYECLHCGHQFSSHTAEELSEKAIEHLKGKCKK